MGVAMQVAAVGLTIAGAQQAKAAYKMEEEAYKEKADLAKLQADQDEVSRNNQLRYQLAALGTSSASRGIASGSTSASTSALAEREKDIAKRDIANIKLMGQATRRSYQISAAGSKAAGKAAFLGGLARAGSMAYSIGQGVGKGQ
tara:strand:- start:9347 stop:9781 length:435 start_codon:yes stop_codon:yes gene_type:complete